MNARSTLILVLVALAMLASLAAAASPAAAATPTTMTLTASPEVVPLRSATTLSAQVDAPGATLTLSRKYAGAADFVVLGSGVTNGAGVFVWRDTPTATATYRVEFAGDATHDPASAEATVGVRPRVSLRVDVRKPVIVGRRITFSVRVAPVHTSGAVVLQRWSYAQRRWVELARLTIGESSTATYSWKPSKDGLLTVRAKMEADADHESGGSALWKTKVIDPSNPYNVPARFPRLILVDLSQYKLYYHEHGHVVRVFNCVLGRPGLPTPKGRFKIYAKDSRMGGPYGPRRMRYLGLFAIHGTNEPWLLRRFPRNYSHGCTRLSNANILWLYSRVRVGTPVWNVP